MFLEPGFPRCFPISWLLNPSQCRNPYNDPQTSEYISHHITMILSFIPMKYHHTVNIMLLMFPEHPILINRKWDSYEISP